MGDEIGTLVLDNGTMMIKAGFAGDDAPRAVFPTVVGRPRHRSGLGAKDSYVGDEAVSKRGILTMKWPIEKGVCTNWDDMEKIWHYSFYNELRVHPGEHCVLLTESIFNPTENREKMLQVMNETFSCQAVNISKQPKLALYSVGLSESGRTTGVGVDIGEGLCQIAPTFEGYILPNSITKVNFGGEDITVNLMKLLTERGYAFTTTAEKSIVRDVKERLSFVSLDFEADMYTCSISSKLERKYELPDGGAMAIGNERFRSPEILFNPSVAELEGIGLHTSVYKSILKSDASIRDDLYKSIALVGGSSLFPGLPERLQKELILLNDSQNEEKKEQKITIIAPPERRYSTWIGGSIFGSLSTFRNALISMEDYNEVGPQVVHRICF